MRRIREYTRSQFRLGSGPAFFDNRIHEGSDAAVDPDCDVVAILQVHRRLLDPADTLRGTGHDDGTRK